MLNKIVRTIVINEIIWVGQKKLGQVPMKIKSLETSRKAINSLFPLY